MPDHLDDVAQLQLAPAPAGLRLRSGGDERPRAAAQPVLRLEHRARAAPGAWSSSLDAVAVEPLEPTVNPGERPLKRAAAMSATAFSRFSISPRGSACWAVH